MEETKAIESSPVNQVFEKFKRIEHNFNKNFLLFSYQLTCVLEGEESEKDVEQCKLLQAAYAKWYDRLQTDPRDMSACLLLYDSVKDYHELLMQRDTQIFTINGDFFSNILGQKGIDTAYLYDQLSDGMESQESSNEPVEDAKDNLWNSIIGLYRLCVLICIYLQMPLVKEIIDMILINNPDLNQNNIFEKIITEFKSKRRLRKMIMKLLKNNGDSFGDIFNSLQKVIATFGSEVNATPNLDAVKQKVRGVFEDILKQSDIKHLDTTQTDRLIAALEDKNEPELTAMITEQLITPDQLELVEKKYKAQGLDKMNVSKVVKDLGSTMNDMMKALESNDENAVKDILAKAGSGMNMDQKEMQTIHEDLSLFEKEAEEDSDDDEELSTKFSKM